MEPVTLILTALGAGASAALSETAAQTMKDAFAGLKALIKRRLADDETGRSLVDRFESDPEASAAPLQQALSDAGAEQDAELVTAAQRVLAVSDPGGTATGKYQVTVTGSQGTVVGDHAQVNQTFGPMSTGS